MYHEIKSHVLNSSINKTAEQSSAKSFILLEHSLGRNLKCKYICGQDAFAWSQCCYPSCCHAYQTACVFHYHSTAPYRSTTQVTASDRARVSYVG